MYILLMFILAAPGLWLMRQGIREPGLRRIFTGLLLAALSPVFFVFISIWGEWLWFENVGFGSRFLRMFVAGLGTTIAASVVAALFAFVTTFRAGAHLRRLVVTLAMLWGAIWGGQHIDTVLLYLYGSPTEVIEPVLGQDTGFYLFNLPFYDFVFWLLLPVAIGALIAVLFVWETGGRITLRHLDEAQGDQAVVPMANAGLAWILSLGMVIAVFHLLYSKWGVVQGPGWIDVTVLHPALLLAAVAFFFVGLLPLFTKFRLAMTRVLYHRLRIGRPAVAAMSVVWAGLSGLALIVLVLVPSLMQWLVVKPNEVTFEKPYIAHNIDFTRRGFRLHHVEERAFTPRALTRETIDANRNLLSEVRLWDWRALDAVYRQFQEIRLYYEFVDVDIDRYKLGDRYRQVMVSARELGQRNLAPQSKTFVNERFKYTHGYGYTAAAVSDFTPEGLPNLLVQDIPPQAVFDELAVSRPEIYYGELTDGAAVVNTKEEEFDYPSGDKNIYTRYSGSGGVELQGFWRKFVFGWKLDGSVLLFSGYPTAESRVMFDRQVSKRVAKVAPFLTFDEDPYIVAHEGRLFWIVDGYTTSDYYPYSQPFDSRGEGGHSVARMDGVTYVRNSVKAVVDAYHGTVELYVFDDEDPIIKAWQGAFPGLFKARGTMPPGLVAHVRYPQDFLLVQGIIYSKYHMSDPEVFYNQEDLWVRATEKHYSSVVPVEPYYVMWELPGSDEAEFVLIQPFTPKNKQVLIGWIAGLSDGDNYGRFLAYNFPKEERMLGPQQVETKIDQDAFLSGQLTLWDQQGSEVIRGNVLAIPIDDALLYVEPIYLRAETAAYPELRLVAVMHGDRLSYAETFEEALAGLFDDNVGGSVAGLDLKALARRAHEAFKRYLEAVGDARFADGAEALATLSQALEAMAASSKADAN